MTCPPGQWPEHGKSSFSGWLFPLSGTPPDLAGVQSTLATTLLLSHRGKQSIPKHHFFGMPCVLPSPWAFSFHQVNSVFPNHIFMPTPFFHPTRFNLGPLPEPHLNFTPNPLLYYIPIHEPHNRATSEDSMPSWPVSDPTEKSYGSGRPPNVPLCTKAVAPPSAPDRQHALLHCP